MGTTLTFYALRNHQGVQAIRGSKKYVDMSYEFFCNHDSVDIRTVADVQEHIGYTRCGRFLEGGQYTPYSINLLLHLFLVMFDHIPFFLGSVLIQLIIIAGIGARRSQADVPELVYHVALGMPMLILPVSKDLDELLENGSLTASTPLCELRGVMVMAVHFPFVFVVAILCAKDCWAHGASEVLDVVFSFKGGNVGAS